MAKGHAGSAPARCHRSSIRSLAMDIRNPSPDLYNEDLAPAKERNRGAFSIFNVGTSDVHT